MSVLWDKEALQSKKVGDSFNIHFSKLKEQSTEEGLQKWKQKLDREM